MFDETQLTRLSSAELCEKLAGMEGQPWGDYGKRGDPITQNQLAKLLKRFNVHPRNIKLASGKVPKGYSVEDFQEVFTRYLAQLGESGRYSATMPENIGDSGLSEPLPGGNGSGCEGEQSPCVYAGGSGVADGKPGQAEPVEAMLL